MQTRQVIETHLKSAQQAAAARLQVLQGKKLDKKASRRDARLREIQALERKYKRRLKALGKIDAVNADLEKRRAEKAAQPKMPKEKKKRAPVATKPAKGGGKKKAEG